MTAALALLLAAELAVALLLAGCSGASATRTGRASRPERHPPVVLLVLDEFPADTLLGPDGQHRRRALSRTSRRWRDLHLVPATAHTVYDSTFKAVPAILDGHVPRAGPRRRAQPPAERLPPAGPARLRRGQGGVGHGRLPAAHLPRRAHAAARRAQAPGRRRAPGAPPPLDRRDPRARRGRRSTSSTRCCRTSPGSTCPPGARAGRPATTRSSGINRPRASTTRSSPTTTICATCSRSATPTASSGELLARLRRTGLLRPRADRGVGRPRLLVRGRRGEPAAVTERTSSRSRRCRSS